MVQAFTVDFAKPTIFNVRSRAAGGRDAGRRLTIFERIGPKTTLTRLVKGRQKGRRLRAEQVLVFFNKGSG